MFGSIYRVDLISGDYAVLRSDSNENTVALALLTQDIKQGDNLSLELI